MPTALVTGASAGLGEGFARKLAERGHDLILVARRRERLDALAGELTGKHGITADVIACDLGEAGAATRLMGEIARLGRPVDVLINNAGFGAVKRFVDSDPATLDGMVAVNCTALMDLCRLTLPDMIARRSGGILNIASTAAFQPGPGMAVYYATKAFVLSLSEALHEEAKPHGVAVAALCPGPTKTEFFDAAGAQDFWLGRFASGADAVIANGLKALDRNQAVRVSGAMNRVAAFSTRLTPRGVLRKVVARLQLSRGA